MEYRDAIQSLRRETKDTADRDIAERTGMTQGSVVRMFWVLQEEAAARLLAPAIEDALGIPRGTVEARVKGDL